MEQCARVTFDAMGDLCLGFFKELWDSEQLTTRLPLGGHVLEVGCAEADWLGAMRVARPDLHLTGVDTRETEPRPAADLFIEGDILQQSFAAQSCDAIVAVSVIEWIGLGFYRGNPTEERADYRLLDLAHGWLKPGGWFYLDMPWRPAGDTADRPRPFRPYTNAMLADLLDRTAWKETTRRHFSGNGHPDGPYVAVILEPQ